MFTQQGKLTMTNRRGDGSIDPDKLKALFKSEQRAREEAGEITAEFAADRKAAVDNHGLHPRAFTLCATIGRMPQVKRLALLNAFDSYRDILKLDDAPQGELEVVDNKVTTLRAAQ